jgi:hypothetical protein
MAMMTMDIMMAMSRMMPLTSSAIKTKINGKAHISTYTM